jgi:hypothetical protein
MGELPLHEPGQGDIILIHNKMLLAKQASTPSWKNSWETSSVKEIPI